ncbi:MAG: hypothetical protein KatS3mg097_558 [Candidatus Parcubacteria bacterium]|nr:MAG: hypothetical protein KatS3mg097_558 [Candidatus Parcubacteria bacterium]
MQREDEINNKNLYNENQDLNFKEFLAYLIDCLILAIIFLFVLFEFIYTVIPDHPQRISKIDLKEIYREQQEQLDRQIFFSNTQEYEYDKQSNQDLVQLKQELEKIKKTLIETKKIVEKDKEKRIEIELQKNYLLSISKDINQKPVDETNQDYTTEYLIEKAKIFIVKVDCFDKHGNIVEGSGILYGLNSNNQSIVLTNNHITRDADFCIISYSTDPTRGLIDFYIAYSVYYPSVIPLNIMELIDFDFLRIEAKFRFNDEGKIEIIPDASLKIINHSPTVCRSDQIKLGDGIIVFGYPGAGGTYLTVTEGIISGYDGDFYLVTSAKIDKGNSGGGAFSKTRLCLVGMPTFAIRGRMESFGRLINMAYIEQNFLSKIFQ